MPVPRHGEKYDSEPVLSVEREAAYARERGQDAGRTPGSVVLCFSETLFEHPSDYPGPDAWEPRSGSDGRSTGRLGGASRGR